MKKLNICAAGIAALFCTYCGDSESVAGTSEDRNNMAYDESSSSILVVEGSSSSSEKGKSSSSFENGKLSSSSELAVSSSSEEKNPLGQDAVPAPSDTNSLDYYLWQYGLLKTYKFDPSVMAISASEMVSRAPGIDGGAGATEFDGQGVRKFVQQNVGALKSFFPKAAEKYADLVDATKNGTNECSLYSFNLYGNEKYAGYVLEYVSPDTMKVVDIQAENCEANMDNQVVRFLFSYCGDVDSDPVIVRRTAVSDIEKEKCPATATDDEWVSVLSSTEIQSSSSQETCMNVKPSECKQDSPCYTLCGSDAPQEVTDCESGKQYTCRAGYWTPSDESFWLTETCDENVEHEGHITVFDNTYKSYSYIDFFCIEGQWIERFQYYECGTDPNCERKHVDMEKCRADEIVGTTCDEKDEESAYVDKDGCEYVCRDGVYEYLPPPVY